MTLEYLNEVTEFLNQIKRGAGLSSTLFGKHYVAITGNNFTFANCQSCIKRQVGEMETAIRNLKDSLPFIERKEKLEEIIKDINDNE